MTGDELIVLMGSAAFGLWSSVQWLRRVAGPSLAPLPSPLRASLGAAPIATLAGVFVALKVAASHDVRDAPQYLLLYLALGSAWCFGAVALLSALGISFRDDVIERRNTAAAIVVLAALAAHAAIYAGSNIGDGPGWWCVVIAGFLGAGAWFVLWWIVESASAASEQVTVERDVPAAIRLGGYILASGFILARGAAGDWTSVGDTLRDFWVAWPAVALAAAAIGIERFVRNQPVGSSRGVAAAIALGHLAVSALAILTAPPLSQNPLYGGG